MPVTLASPAPLLNSFFIVHSCLLCQDELTIGLWVYFTLLDQVYPSVFYFREVRFYRQKNFLSEISLAPEIQEFKHQLILGVIKRAPGNSNSRKAEKIL